MVDSGLKRLLAALSASAVAAALLVGIAPSVQAVPAASDADPSSGVVRRGEKVRNLSDGLCAKAVPLGLVQFIGPGGIKLTARVRQSGGTKLLTVISGTGSIGGVKVRPRDVSGELTWRGGKAKNSPGSMTGSVSVALVNHPKVVRDWAQTVNMTAAPSGCNWISTVTLRAEGVGASLDLRGPVDEDGSYELRGSGKVGIARTSVPISGWLRSPNRAGYDPRISRIERSSETTWRITGTTKRDVRIPGARLENVNLSLTHAAGLVRGTATVQLEVPRLTAPAVLQVAGSNTWTAVVNGSNRRMWIVPKTEGLEVTTGELAGAIGMRQGTPLWTLHSPGTVSIDELDYATEVGFTGPLQYTVEAKAAVGTILDLPGMSAFQGVPTKLTITPKGMTGAMSVATPGDLLLTMGPRWKALTAYAVLPVPGQGWTFTAGLTHTLRSGKGAIRLTGPVVGNGVDLVGSGTLEVSDTLVPVHGYYRTTSFVDGSTPVWALAAYPGEAKGGRIPLQGGAGMVGGVFIFDGQGAQPISTIPDAPSTATGSGRSVRIRPMDSTDDTASDDSSSAVTISGTTTVQLTETGDDTFYLPVDYTYTDADNWSATAAGTTPSNAYSPFTGLAIPETDFSGTITDEDGVETWDVSISMQDWQNFANGVSYQGSFDIANYCTLDEDECPPDSTDDSNTIFLSGTSTFTFNNTSIPTLYATGSFVSDGSWARWDAVATESVTFDDITLSSPEVTIWKGTQGDSNPDLVLPDLSDLNGENGMNLEFCADFVVTIPDVDTLDTNGCAMYSPDGVVMGQLNTGGSVEPGDYNGITVDSATLSGWTWNGLDTIETVFLNGVEIAAETDINY
ncbi:MAG: hypothetical protein VW082_11930, partial [Candidatus Nanopelagicales bacterium]